MQDNTHKSPSEESPEKSYYQMRCDFYEKFKNEITPRLEPFEKERQAQYAHMKKMLFCAVVLGVLILWSKSFLFFIIFILFISRMFTTVSKSVEHRIKTYIMPVVCSCYGDLKWKQPNPMQPLMRRAIMSTSAFGIPSREREQLRLAASLEHICGLDDSFVIYPYGISKYDDIFEGKYKGVRYDILEAASNVRGADRPAFRGVVLRIELNKQFKGHTLVCKNTILHKPPSKTLRHTVLEDVNFEEKFDVFCDDEIEARYLLTTAFMQRLNNLKTAFLTDEISCAFYDSKLFIALFTKKDLFTLSVLNKPVYDFSQYETFHNEIISILKLIDYFKLNEKTGL